MEHNEVPQKKIPRRQPFVQLRPPGTPSNFPITLGRQLQQKNTYNTTGRSKLLNFSEVTTSVDAAHRHVGQYRSAIGFHGCTKRERK